MKAKSNCYKPGGGDKLFYVIADDLTGANDTGVQFYKHGYNVDVAIEDYKLSKTIQSNKENQARVLVIDTETREENLMITKEKLNSVLGKFEFLEQDIIYKKIDSTLRGNIGAEIEIIMNIFAKDLCIISPTFSSNKRFTIGGYLIVNNQPLGLSSYNDKRLDPGKASFIPEIIAEQTQLPIGMIELKEVIKGKESIFKALRKLYYSGKKIIIVDSMTKKHLQDILYSATRIKAKIMLAGSAGLAECLAEKNTLAKQKLDLSFNEFPFLIVNGSRNRISNQQINYLVENKNAFIFNLNVADLLADKFAIKKYYDDILKDYSKSNFKYLIIRPDPCFINQEIIKDLIKEYELDFRQLGTIIRNKTAELVESLIKYYQIKNMIITGGDTLVGICQKLGVKELKIMGEVLPGIPLTESVELNYFKKSKLNFITKAGGFGEPDTLLKVINKITRR